MALTSYLNQFRAADGFLDVRAAAFVTLLVFTLMASDLSQLAFVLVGAFTYAGVQAMHVQRPVAKGCKLAPNNKALATSGCLAERPTGANSNRARACGTPAAVPEWRRQHCGGRPTRAAVAQPARDPAAPVFRQPSSQPVAALSLGARGWDAEAAETVQLLACTAKENQAVHRLAESVRHILQRMVPEVEVMAVASGSPSRGTAFGVAVPEVDVTVSVPPHVLASRLQLRGLGGGHGGGVSELDARKLQKSAIRTFADALVTHGGFKFRRSAFRCQDPKVTFLAPQSAGFSDQAIPIDFSVNSTTPLHNAALMMEAGNMEPVAKSLILLVRRWAKDRGICHASKGHMAPYCWTLLVIYFLQVGVEGEGPTLPTLDGFPCASGLALRGRAAGGAGAAQRAPSRSQDKPVGALLKEFVHFYAKEFDWRNEVVSLRSGARRPPGPGLPISILTGAGGETVPAPHTEDPFNPTRNLSEGMTFDALLRLRVELARAQEICTRAGSSLTELLEPWAPPERAEAAAQDTAK